MRKLEKFTTGFSDGYRSDSNGPIEVKEHISTHFFDENEVFKRYYRKVKPYERIETVFSLPKAYPVTLNSGAVVFYNQPSTADIALSVRTAVLNKFNESIFDIVTDSRDATNEAIQRSLNYGQVLLYVSAAEAGKTLLLFKNLYTRLFTIVKDLYKSVRKLNVIATADIIADVWLELRYGWRPLLFEIEGIAKALTVVRPNGIKSSYGLYKAPKRLHKTDSVFLENVHVEVDGFLTIFDVTLSEFDDATRKTGFNYVNKPGSRNVDWKAIFGLDFESLASTAWELIPFSFIVDMFINIGNLLQAHEYVDQVDSFNGYMTNRLRCKISAVAKDVQAFQEPVAADLVPLGLTATDSLYFKNAYIEYLKREAADYALNSKPLRHAGPAYSYYQNKWEYTSMPGVSPPGGVTGYYKTLIDPTFEDYDLWVTRRGGNSIFSVVTKPLQNKYYAAWSKNPTAANKARLDKVYALHAKLLQLDRVKFDTLFAATFSVVPASVRRQKALRADGLLSTYPGQYSVMRKYVPRGEWPGLKRALVGMYFNKWDEHMEPRWAITLKMAGYFSVQAEFLPYEKDFSALFLERIERDEFNMSVLADTALNNYQTADLVAIGYKLGKSLSKKL